jgi:adenylate kinase
MDAAQPMPNHSAAPRIAAVLLVGPTGAGKTPLGDWLEARGLWGRPCAHFDFGANLRACAAGEGRGAGLTRNECTLLEQMLQAGALLHDEHFPIAEKVLRAFLADRRIDPQALVVLNGLPRHVGQAEDLQRILRIEAVVHLSCPSRVACERVRTNAGGDRTGRGDDDVEAVERKIVIFQERTAPLLAWYRRRGVPIITVEVAAETAAGTMWRRINRSRPNPA